MKKITLILAIVSIFLLAGCDEPRCKYSRTVDLNLLGAGGKTLIIKNNIGSIKINGDNRGDGVGTATITGKGLTPGKAKEVAEKIEIQIENRDDEICIVTKKPLGLEGRHYAVSFQLDLPDNMPLKLETNIGKIDINNMKESINAISNIGKVNCSNAFAAVNLRTNIGEVCVTYDKQFSTAVNVNLSTNIGSAKCTLPKDASAKIDASVNIGSINTSLPITVSGKICNKRLNGQIGSGQGNVKMSTNIGSIDIK